MEAIRCTLVTCKCDCFQPGKPHVRVCESCGHGWVAHALDKLGFRSIYQPLIQVEIVQPSVVFDIASLMLYGAQATPIRLKMLLDRLFSVLQHDEVLQVLHGFGWSYEDYARGYILQDPSGRVLDKWTITTREEEQVIIQQFLRFGETKSIAQEIILQDAYESRTSHLLSPPKNGSDIKKFLDRSTAPSVTRATPSNSNLFHGLDARYSLRNFTSTTSPAAFGFSNPKLLSPLSIPGYPPLQSVLSSAKETPTKSVTSSPMAGSPLSRLQTMQPFDYRKRESSPRRSVSPISRNIPCGQLSCSTTPGSSPVVSLPNQLKIERGLEPMPSAFRAIESIPKDSSGALDFSTKETFKDKAVAKEEKKGSSYTSETSVTTITLNMQSDSQHKSRNGIRKPVSSLQRRNYSPTPGYGGTLLSPSGKKRVLCTACNKTFCDKGALKIHYSAVHLKEMHKCTVDGCCMMFSSRRSRNRHSANPNPKLHMPQNRRKLPDGAILVDEKKEARAASGHGGLTDVGGKHHHAGSVSGQSDLLPIDLKPINMLSQHLIANSLSPVPNTTPYSSSEASGSPAKYRRLGNDSAACSDQPQRDNAAAGQYMTSARKRKSVAPTRCAPAAEVYDMSDEEGECASVSEDGMDPRGHYVSGASTEDLSQEDLDEDGVYMDDEYKDLSRDDEAVSTGAEESIDIDDHKGAGSSGMKTYEDEDDYDSMSDVEDVLGDGKDFDQPKQCPECNQLFPNHFTVKAHYQNVHLKLMHNCTVEGCNAAFPSKRSRDRHSSNLNLHRKLLSTSSTADKSDHLSSSQSLRNDFLSHIYDSHHLQRPSTSESLEGAVHRGLTENGNGVCGDNTLRGGSPAGQAIYRAGNLNPTSPVQMNGESSGVGDSDADSRGEEKSIDEENNEKDYGWPDHRLTIDIPRPDPSGDVQCHICNNRFRDNLILKEHFEKVHPREMYRCTIVGCDKIFSTRKSRNRHSQNDNLHKHLPISKISGIV